ncbi:MAG: mandelate racemase/muconate lactonizing enzyme family protein, partial [Burkholderiales bacterium]|nr:mandelate racemase/muconate lactonizing enzyme family protein [Burkholderiales bacterium]
MIVDVAAFSARISPKTVWTFVRARDAAGRTGWGEATLQGAAAAIHAHVARLAPAIVKRPQPSPLEVACIAGTHGGRAAESAAISAVDQALWDIAAQERGQPLARALGSPRRSTIELYANINRGTLLRSPAGFAARARAAASGGFAALKIAPFDDVRPGSVATPEGRRLVAAGIERVAAVRDAIGPECALLVDCHWRLTEAAASEILRELEPLRLYWFECPLPEEPGNFAALRRLRAQANAAGVRLAGCESLTGVAAFESFLDAGVYDAIMPDVKYAGGLLEILRIGDAAARHGTICSPHNPSGPIAHAHSVHVSA